MSTEQNTQLLFHYINIFEQLGIKDELALEILKRRGITLPTLY